MNPTAQPTSDTVAQLMARWKVVQDGNLSQTKEFCKDLLAQVVELLGKSPAEDPPTTETLAPAADGIERGTPESAADPIRSGTPVPAAHPVKSQTSVPGQVKENFVFVWRNGTYHREKRERDDRELFEKRIPVYDPVTNCYQQVPESWLKQGYTPEGTKTPPKTLAAIKKFVYARPQSPTAEKKAALDRRFEEWKASVPVETYVIRGDEKIRTTAEEHAVNVANWKKKTSPKPLQPLLNSANLPVTTFVGRGKESIKAAPSEHATVVKASADKKATSPTPSAGFVNPHNLPFTTFVVRGSQSVKTTPSEHAAILRSLAGKKAASPKPSPNSATAVTPPKTTAVKTPAVQLAPKEVPVKATLNDGTESSKTSLSLQEDTKEEGMKVAVVKPENVKTAPIDATEPSKKNLSLPKELKNEAMSMAVVTPAVQFAPENVKTFPNDAPEPYKKSELSLRKDATKEATKTAVDTPPSAPLTQESSSVKTPTVDNPQPCRESSTPCQPEQPPEKTTIDDGAEASNKALSLPKENIKDEATTMAVETPAGPLEPEQSPAKTTVDDGADASNKTLSLPKKDEVEVEVMTPREDEQAEVEQAVPLQPTPLTYPASPSAVAPAIPLKPEQSPAKTALDDGAEASTETLSLPKEDEDEVMTPREDEQPDVEQAVLLQPTPPTYPASPSDVCRFRLSSFGKVTSISSVPATAISNTGFKQPRSKSEIKRTKKKAAAARKRAASPQSASDKENKHSNE